MYLGSHLGLTLDDTSLVWAGGVPVADVPPPPPPDFPFACLYSDGSRELVSDASSCPSKPGLDLIEVDDLTQVSPGPPQIPPSQPPAISVNVPIDGGPPILTTVPTLPTLPPPIMPVTFPAPPIVTAPAPMDATPWPWWLIAAGVLLLLGSQHRGRRVST